MSDMNDTQMLTEEQEMAIDQALNALALDTLSFMNDRVVQNEAIPESERPYIMLHACEAVTFNIIMHIAEQAGIDPKEIAERTKANLVEAVAGFDHHHEDGCCGGGEHTH